MEDESIRPQPTPGIISSMKALENVNFKTIIGSVTHFDDPSINGPAPYLADLSMHYWHLQPGEIDNQKPHLQDEIYIIMEGKGQVEVDGKVSAVSSGDIIFVPAKMAHHFIADVVESMKILIFFGPNWDGKNP